MGLNNNLGQLSENIKIGENGKVGIGKNSPNTPLDISGSTLITGSLTVTQGITGSLFGTSTNSTTLDGHPSSDFVLNSSTGSFATETYVNTAVSNLVDSSPTTLNTLNELAAALGDDPNFATTITTSIGTKLPLAGGTMSGAISFAAGQTWPTFNQNTTGTAATLTTARTINGVSFNGSANITITDSTKQPQLSGTGFVKASGTTISYDNSTYVPTSRTITINGTALDLSANRSFTVTGADSTKLPLAGGILTGGLTVGYGGGDLTIRATSGDDLGDLVWANYAGTEKHRLWDGGTGLTYRNNGGTGYLLLHAGNYNSYSPSLQGTSANGTWGISITGNAASSTNVGGITPSQIVYGGAGRASSNPGTFNDPNQKSGFYYANGATGAPDTDWQNWMTVAGNDWQSSNNYSFQISHAFHSDNFYVRKMVSGVPYGWRKILDAGNYNSYSPTLTGTGASGTWGIDITGTAANVTSNNSRTDVATYPVVWTNGNASSPNYSCAAVNIQSSTGTLQATTLRATADVVAYYSSDKRFKDNITPIANALEKVKQIGGYEFDWNDTQQTHTGHDMGIIAQEVEKIFPEIVANREDGYKSVKYERLIPVLIEAIKEQQTQIEELKQLVNQLIKK